MSLIENNSLIFQPKQPLVGDIVTYTLLPAHRPTNPKRVWQGKVLSLASGGVMVELLDEGYEGLREFVKTIQFVTVAAPKQNPTAR